jgi:hypothetical protein
MGAMTTAHAPFGKLNATRSTPPAVQGRGTEGGNRWGVVLALVVTAAGMAALAIAFPHLRSFTWWFGPKPETPYMVVATLVGVAVLAALNRREDAQRRRRLRERQESAGPGEIVLPDWCVDYSASDGGGSDGGGGDGGGDGGGGGD